MFRLCLHLLAAVGALAAAMALWTSFQQLPLVVASRFGEGGTAAGFMSRGAYLTLMTALSVGLPLLMLLAFIWLPRHFASALRVPNQMYWLSPERRETLLDLMGNAGLLLAGATLLFMGSLLGLILRANAASPPHLDMQPFLLALGMFVAVSLAVPLWLSWRLRRR